MSRALLTVDLGFGDSGKGSIVDFLTRQYEAHTVIRYNGGAQAGHRVVTADGREHVFSQFGSGSLAGAATHLSRYMLLEPLAMLEEARHLRELGCGEPFDQTTIDANALIITPFARAINRLSELARGDTRHGSCGMGIGETMVDFLEYSQAVLFAGDLRDPRRLRQKLEFLRKVNRAKLKRLEARLPDTAEVRHEREPLDEATWIEQLLDEYADWAALARIVSGEHLHTMLQRPGCVIFEAAQGVLLDEWRGFHPHTTWSTTTLANANQLLREANYAGEIQRIGLTRAYTTRHGAGPLPTEDAALTALLPDACNRFGDWQQGFRIGWLDLVLLRYALSVTGPLDSLALSCLDRVQELPEYRYCPHYYASESYVERLKPGPAEPSLSYQEELTQLLFRSCPQLSALDVAELPELLTRELGLPVEILSYGPRACDKMPGLTRLHGK